MKRTAIVCFSACCLLAGCKGQSTVADPFLPATRIPPPATGAATGIAPATPYYAPPTGAPAVGPPIVTPGGSYVPPPGVGYGASLNQPPSVYRPQASRASTGAAGALGARPAAIAPAATAPESGFSRPNTSPGWTGAPATNSRDDLLTSPPASTRYASQTTRAASDAAASSSALAQTRQPHTGTVSIPESARTTAPEPLVQSAGPTTTQAGATTSAPRAAVQQATEITDLPLTRPLDGRRPKGFQSPGA